jgi:hypothetical protein
VLVRPEKFRGNFSVKEKDEASLSNDFRQDSLNAFILRFAGVEGFFVAAEVTRRTGSEFPPPHVGGYKPLLPPLVSQSSTVLRSFRWAN